MNSGDIHNRFTYHPPSEDQGFIYQDIRDHALDLAHFLNIVCPDSREKSLAITAPEEAVFWANAAIARNP